MILKVEHHWCRADRPWNLALFPPEKRPTFFYYTTTPLPPPSAAASTARGRATWLGLGLGLSSLCVVGGGSLCSLWECVNLWRLKKSAKKTHPRSKRNPRWKSQHPFIETAQIAACRLAKKLANFEMVKLGLDLSLWAAEAGAVLNVLRGGELQKRD